MQCLDKDGKPTDFEHVDMQTLSKINDFIGMFKALFRGNGKVVLVISGGNICDIEVTTRTAIKRDPAISQ